jgi:molybdate transport system substrate-binding protein
VRAGSPRPQIGSSDALKRTLVDSTSIAYSTSASGAYMSGLFERMGIADAVKLKVRQSPPGVPVGELVARGEAQIGFQQISELLPLGGIDYLGPLPADIQHYTTFSAGLHSRATQPEAAKALVRFLRAPSAAPIIRKLGMEPS